MFISNEFHPDPLVEDPDGVGERLVRARIFNSDIYIEENQFALI